MKRFAVILFLLLPVLTLAGDKPRPPVVEKPAQLPAEPPVVEGFPRAVITGPSTAQVGDILRLNFSRSTYDVNRCYVEPEEYPDGTETFELEFADDNPTDVQSVLLATRPGSTFRVELICANAKGIDRKIQNVTISGTAPPVPEPPIVKPPVNPPTVPPVDPMTTLPAWVAVCKVKSVTTDPARQTTAEALAVNYRNWASAGATVNTVKQYLETWNALNIGQLKQMGKLQAWDAFNKALADKIVSMKLTTVPQYCEAWVKIAEGLEAKP